MKPFAHYALDDWLAHIQAQHWRSVDMQLERVTRVWRALNGAPSDCTITITGTNGKGSCAALLESVLRAANLRVGVYTSPHLMRYNERVRIDGVAVDDELLCETFLQIERARADVPLTYFEFGTLCALRIFELCQVQVAVLEVGMGGRLDAVNIIDNDIALITSIGIDHTAWLGTTRDAIAREKAGVLKPNRLAVCAQLDAPPCIAQIAAARNCKLMLSGVDYVVGGDIINGDGVGGGNVDGNNKIVDVDNVVVGDKVADNSKVVDVANGVSDDKVGGNKKVVGTDKVDNNTRNARDNNRGCDNPHAARDGFWWRSDCDDIPLSWRRIDDVQPPFGGARQAGNLGGVIAVLALLSTRLRLSRAHLHAGLDALAQAGLPGRCQTIRLPNGVELILDVAHNADAGAELRAHLAAAHNDNTRAVVGMLADKPFAQLAALLRAQIHHWHLATLSGDRGQGAAALRRQLRDATDARATLHESPLDAYHCAVREAGAGGRVVVFGSFQTVGDIMRHLAQSNAHADARG